jgi:hypothetical protein
MFRLTGSVSFVAHTFSDPRAMGARRAARWVLRAALERLIEYLLESAGAATLLMVKEAIVKTVG